MVPNKQTYKRTYIMNSVGNDTYNDNKQVK